MRVQWSLIVIMMLSVLVQPAQAQQSKPFIMPMNTPPGPSTWLMGQPYGNTTGAYNFGTAWYSAGQGLHFGIDVSMPCGTELVAVADGEVIYADNLAFGAGPHNLIMRHSTAGVTTLYGHLLDRPVVQPGQTVAQGQVVGYSGDPDVTCDSRPHLHLEVRSLDYRTAYNPVDYINVNWHNLLVIGPFGFPLFAQNLDNARQWMSIDDQPPVAFGGARLNAYAAVWPPARGELPPNNPPLARPYVPLPADVTWSARVVGIDGCCANPYWHPTNANTLYTVDGAPGSRAAIFEWDASSGGMVSLTGQAPPPILSSDGSHQVVRSGDGAVIRRLADGAEWFVTTQGSLPSINTDSTQMLWVVQAGQSVPGATQPNVAVWVSAMDGSNARQIVSQQGGGALWLDGSRILLSVSQQQNTTLTVYDTRDGSSYALGTWYRLRGLSVAPGGARLLFYVAFGDPAQNGVNTIETAPGAAAQKLPWFGGWRWRDSESVYYIPFEPNAPAQTLAYYHIPTGEDRVIPGAAETPLTIANGDWALSPDGRRIAYLNALDRRMWVADISG